MDLAIPAPERPLEAGRRLASLPDDRLGSMVMVAVASELVWTPDVGPAVMDRLERDAAAYPEHFARAPGFRWRPVASASASAEPRRRNRLIGLLSLLAVVIAAAIAVLVMMPRGVAAFGSLIGS